MKRFAVLEGSELTEVMNAGNRNQLACMGYTDSESAAVFFWLGDDHTVRVPFSAFTPSTGGKETPDFSKFSIIDCGQTLKFGDYEASVVACLSEYDPQYVGG
jgi:hypothetical protein